MADEKGEKEDGAKEEPEAKAGPNIVLIIAALLVVQVLLVGGGIFLVSQMANKDDAPKQSVLPEPVQAGGIDIANEVVYGTKFTDVTVNIVGSDGRFLLVTLAIAYDGKSKANQKLEAQLAVNETQLKNTILTYLSTLTLDQITQNSNIQNEVRTNLLRELNNTIPQSAGRLSNVYIEKWLVS
ncbi:MAG: flagellar basal body-associated FliL family protein [Chitinivibrionia bacterium]|nr:flagellar basal body-associated FliL family protein [Chitinivibrionia bacterium]